MRIERVHLKNYKRFTELVIADLPGTARLVVLVGPNGTGKSSVFDSFLLKAGAAANNYRLEGDKEQYYEKIPASRTTHQVAARVTIQFHGGGPVDWAAAFQVRSAYRSESDFQINEIRTTLPTHAGSRITRIIDHDVSVSKNYERMVWKSLHAQSLPELEGVTFGEYRKTAMGDLQEAMRGLFSEPALLLQDFGGHHGGSFRFTKGDATDFHYKNLSGGEKAVFDVLLDVFMKRDECKEAVFCIDEPELHVATALQGPLITAILKLLREPSQLWVATHSIGVVREAYRMHLERPEEVVFLDFSGDDFDSSVTLTPSTPNRAFWENMYRVALDDLSSLVAPQRVVICEGSTKQNVKAFDAQCYRRLFSDEFPDTLFISQGGSGEVVRSEHLVSILKAVASGIEIEKLVDRDDMSDRERAAMPKKGIRVLRRRELEEYLYDPEVLRTFLRAQDCDASVVDAVLNERLSLLDKQSGPPNIKEVSRQLFEAIRKSTRLSNLGRSRQEFAFQFLVPALRKTPIVYRELREDVFGTP